MLKKILDFYESSTHIRLRKVCEEYGASVFPKVRLADILPIENSGIPQDEYRFALQAHFDFIISDNKLMPLFAVEFDGNSHKSHTQQRRDAIKNKLCARFQLPLLRINSRHLVQKYRNMDILSWLVAVWFLQMDFDRQQQAGNIPFDESFDPFMIIAMAGARDKFPFWVSGPLRIKIQNLCQAGKCKDFAPSEVIGVDSNGNYHALGWLRISDDTAVLAETGMRSQQFPIILSDILGELLVYELYDQVTDYLAGKLRGQPLSEIRHKLEVFKSSYKLTRQSACSDVSGASQIA
jgi:hypothetical protein